jgi:two-component system cell cycle response regulator
VRILIADDDLVSCQMLKRTLESWGYTVISSHDGTTALRILQGPDAPKLAILDWVMPGLDGPEVIRRLRARGDEPYTYVMLLTCRSRKDDLVEGMDAGADDYLSKPFDVHELRVRLRAGSRLIQLQQELITAREALRIQATRDALTDMLNRRAILDRLDQALGVVSQEGRPLGLLMVDLDHFKTINDTYGHPVGDDVLVEAAERMKLHLRRYDGIGRFGGEEFLVVLPGCDERATMATAERLRESLTTEPIASKGLQISVTCSVGAAVHTAENGSDAESLIHDADRALYVSKETGRNRVTAAWQLAVLERIAS